MVKYVFTLEETNWIADLILKCDGVVTYCVDDKLFNKPIASLYNPTKRKVECLSRVGTKRCLWRLMFDNLNQHRNNFFNRLIRLNALKVRKVSGRKLYFVDKERLIEVYLNSVFGSKFDCLSNEIYTLMVK